MLILTEPVRLYGKYVISDLATRVAPANNMSFCPYSGMRYTVNKLWPNGTSSTEADIEMLFNQQPDFDADMMKPQNTAEDGNLEELREEEDSDCAKYNPYVDTYPILRYYRRLEDIDPYYIERYVGNAVYSIQVRNNNGLRAYTYNNAEQVTLFNNSDDGDSFEELADLQLDVDVNEWSPEIKQEAAERLPYVIKRLHTLSCYCSIHMLSFISAYLKAKEENSIKRANGSTMTLKINAVLDKGVYRCDRDGYIQKQLDAKNRNKHAAEMFDWITGNSSSYESYIIDYKNFVHYCDVLGIDILNDNMRKYDARFVKNLTVSVVTPNTQYDKQVFSVLCAGGNTAVKPSSELDPLVNTYSLFLELSKSNEWLSKGIETVSTSAVKDIDSFLYQFLFNYNQLASKLQPGRPFLNVMDISFQTSYATYRGDLFYLDSNLLGKENFADRRCILSNTGYLIMLSHYDLLDVMSISDALDNVMAKLQGDLPPRDWRRLIP